jgi:hypothetical protein
MPDISALVLLQENLVHSLLQLYVLLPTEPCQRQMDHLRIEVYMIIIIIVIINICEINLYPFYLQELVNLEHAQCGE